MNELERINLKKQDVFQLTLINRNLSSIRESKNTMYVFEHRGRTEGGGLGFLFNEKQE